MTPKVSVVLLTYNHRAYIAAAIESVLMQQGPFPVELIITDDHSTDGTWDIVEEFARRFPERITTIRSARNLNTNEVTTRAIDIARGDYIAFLDGDDFWTAPDKLAKQVDFLEEDPFCAMCCHDASIIDLLGNPVASSFREDNPAPDIGSYRELIKANYVAGPTPMIRRSALDRLPAWFVDVEFGDWPLYLCAAQHGHIGYLPEAMAAYRVHHAGYWSGLSSIEQIERKIGFLGSLAQSGPNQWRHLFLEQKRKCIQLHRLAEAPAVAQLVELDLADLDLPEPIETSGSQFVNVAVAWGEAELGTLSIEVDHQPLQRASVAEKIATTGIAWSALALLFEQTAYPLLTFTEGRNGYEASLDGIKVAWEIPEEGPERIRALHEQADWNILLQQAVTGPGTAIRPLLPFIRRGHLVQAADLTIDAAQPLPTVVTPLREISVSFVLGRHLLGRQRFETRFGMVKPAVLHEARFGWGYQLVEAAFHLGVVGFRLGDRTPLAKRLRSAREG